MTEKKKLPYSIGIGFDENLQPIIKNKTGFTNNIQILTALDVVKNKLNYDIMSEITDVKINELLISLSTELDKKEDSGDVIDV